MIAFTNWDDVYAREVERLTENPQRIKSAWHDSTPLFQFARRGPTCQGHGCLTMIRHDSNYIAQTPALTKAIRDDDRIPKFDLELTPDHLPYFAEWQRDIDAMFGVEAPAG